MLKIWIVLKLIKDFIMVNFGCLKTTPLNIGEEIQEIAAMRFLPQIDEFVHREHINKFVSKDKKNVTDLFLSA